MVTRLGSLQNRWEQRKHTVICIHHSEPIGRLSAIFRFPLTARQHKLNHYLTGAADRCEKFCATARFERFDWKTKCKWRSKACSRCPQCQGKCACASRRLRKTKTQLLAKIMCLINVPAMQVCSRTKCYDSCCCLLCYLRGCLLVHTCTM